MNIRVVAATRLSSDAFWEQALLGRSLRHPVHGALQHTIFSDNSRGLPALYNQVIATATEEVLIFCHDDLSLPAEPLEPTITGGFKRFDILGLAGNSRDQQHLAWQLHPNHSGGWDFPYLRGEMRHGNPETAQKDVYGLCEGPVSLIDGVWIAARPRQLLEAKVRFDERFQFHFYDLDLCRSAREQGLSIGIVQLACVHASAGNYGSGAWQAEARNFCRKWNQPEPEQKPPGDSAPIAQPRPAAAFQQGRLAYRAGRYNEAIAAFTNAVQECPRHGWSWLQLANSQHRNGDPLAAISSLRKLTGILPGCGEGWRNLALLLEQQGEAEQARHCAELLLLAAPRDPEAIETLALLLIRQNAQVDAESLLRASTQVLGSEAKSSRLWLHLSRLLLSRGDSRRAYRALHNGSLLAGDDPQILLPKAALLLEEGRPQAALENIEKVLAANPDQLEALQRKAEILQHLGQCEQALAVCRQGLALAADHIQLLLLQGYASQMLCAWAGWDQQLAAIARALEGRSFPQRHQREEELSPLPPLGLLTLAVPQRLIIQEIDRWVLTFGEAETEPRSPLPAVHGERRPLRIGYLSADFRSHAMGWLLEGLFEAHDPNQAESFAYAISPISDAVTSHYEASAKHFRRLHGRTDADCLEQIRADQLDVLLDLSGLTTFSRPALIRGRAAPLQLSYLGFPGSQGNHYVDGILADAVLIPPELSANYAEPVWRLPHTFAARWRQPAPDTSRSSLGLPDKAVVYCCFNRAEKIAPEIFSVWISVLQAVPNSVLWLLLKPEAERHLRLRWQASGLAQQRLIVASHTAPIERFIAAMACADLFIDTTGFNAGAIGVLALNAGLPLLTLAGERFTARMGASLCHATGLDELVAADLHTYQQRAIELGSDRSALEALRRRLAVDPEALPLFQQRRWVSDLIELLKK